MFNVSFLLEVTVFAGGRDILSASIMKDAYGTDFPPAGGIARVFLRSAVLMFGQDKAFKEARDVMYIEDPSSK